MSTLFGMAAKAQTCHFRYARLSHVSTIWRLDPLAAFWLSGMRSSLAKVLAVWSLEGNPVSKHAHGQW